MLCFYSFLQIYTCLTPPHYLCMWLSQVRSLSFSGCHLFVCYIFVFRSFFYWNKAFSFLVWIDLHCHIGAYYSWLCGMGFAHCWRPYGDLLLLMSVSFWSLVDSCLIGNHTTSSFLYRSTQCSTTYMYFKEKS